MNPGKFFVELTHGCGAMLCDAIDVGEVKVTFTTSLLMFGTFNWAEELNTPIEITFDKRTIKSIELSAGAPRKIIYQRRGNSIELTQELLSPYS